MTSTRIHDLKERNKQRSREERERVIRAILGDSMNQPDIKAYTQLLMDHEKPEGASPYELTPAVLNKFLKLVRQRLVAARALLTRLQSEGISSLSTKDLEHGISELEEMLVDAEMQLLTPVRKPIQ